MKRILVVACMLLCLFAVACAKEEEPAQMTMSELGGRPEGMPEGMEMPEGGMPEGMSMPEGLELPEGMELSEGMGERPTGGNQGEAQGMPLSLGEGEIIGRVESIVGNRATLLLGSVSGGEVTYGTETAAYLLPVGMAIGTGDFSSVSAGMVLKLSLETAADGTENITAVSIVSR